MRAIHPYFALLVVAVSLPASQGAAFVSPSTATTTTSTASTARTTTHIYSIPNPLDTLTSGLASICRLPNGVTALEAPPTPDGQLDAMPKVSQLWDIENNADCRVVREALTELDVVVGRVIPASDNARAFLDAASPYYLPANTPIPRLALEESNGAQVVLSGKDEIMAYLQDWKEQQQAASSAEENTNMEEWKETALRVWNTVGNTLATALRVGRGSQVASCAQYGGAVAPVRPKQALMLYSYEGNQFCRLVREVLTELDINYELRSAGKESPRRSELASITGGSSQCPYLIDPNTGMDMAESKDIVEYLYKTYARWTPPNEVLEWASEFVIPLLKPVFQTLAPLQAGSTEEDKSAYEQGMAQARRTIEEDTQQNAVVVYTYELSPFCYEATDLLTRLGVDFKEVSLGKEWVPGLISPEGAQTRVALLEMTGQSSLPHVFIGAKSIGGLFSGAPGLIPALEQGRLDAMVESSTEILTKRKSFSLDTPATTEASIQEEDTAATFE